MNKNILVVAVIAVVIAGFAWFSGVFSGNAEFGSTSCESNTCLTGGLVVGGDVTASSTSLTTAIGCIQLHATSTATWIKQVFVTTGATSTYGGTVYWSYGTCTS